MKKISFAGLTLIVLILAAAVICKCVQSQIANDKEKTIGKAIKSVIAPIINRNIRTLNEELHKELPNTGH